MSPIRINTFDARSFLAMVLGVIVVGGLVVYFAFQARFLLLGPQIMLADTLPVVHTTPTVWLEGSVANIVSLTINGRQIFTDPRGYFREAVVLENGYTVATVAARDRYGRTTTVRREFVYIPATLIH
jgi:hypothetical protein